MSPTSRRRHNLQCECDRDTLDTPWKAQLCMVLHAGDGSEEHRLLAEFLDQQTREVCHVLQRVKRIAHLERGDEDLALSYFGQALMRMVKQRWRAKDGPGTSPVFNYARNLPFVLEAETRSCIRDDRRRGLLDGSAGVPGGSTQDRRTAHVQKSRQLFEVEHGCRPTEDELVAFHNERMRATRKDAARQSVLITRKDLHVAYTVPLDAATTEIDARQATSSVEDSSALDWSDRIAAVLAQCEQLDRDRDAARTRQLKREPVRSADVARVYFAHHAIGEYPTRAEIIEQLGMNEPAARRELSARLQDVLDVARELFADYSRTT